MQALKCILGYLKQTIFHGLHIVATRKLELTAFCEADWGGDSVGRKSTGAYIVYVGSNAISGHAKKKSIIARSSTKAEYRTIETPLRVNSYGYNNYSWSLELNYPIHQIYFQIIFVLLIFVQIHCFIHE